MSVQLLARALVALAILLTPLTSLARRASLRHAEADPSHAWAASPIALVGAPEMPAAPEVPGAIATTRLVTSTDDSGVGSLRAALIAAGDGDAIIFSGLAANSVITLTSGELTVTKAITIDG